MPTSVYEEFNKMVELGSDRMEKVLKDLAKRNPEIEEALKRAGLL